ncbi:MAG TPA: hypothetical protein PLF81_11355, partial [Candidatus Anammoximicrobium sp.]|nr:hypothetical protein [Candidatus Anammoximicrobium sp.]
MRKPIRNLVAVLITGAATVAVADPLGDIARTIEGKARRASSGLFDPESNADAWHVQPGQTVTLTTL